MKLKEYLHLHEMAMQAVLADGFKPMGTFTETYGEKAEAIAKMLGARVTDTVYVMKATTGAQKGAVAAVMKQTPQETEGVLSLIRLAGGRKVVHDGTHIITSKEQLDSFVR